MTSQHNNSRQSALLSEGSVAAMPLKMDHHFAWPSLARALLVFTPLGS
jgi:hypothetical protein